MPIDSIFISNNLLISAGDYLPFGLAQIDYCALWIKLKINLTFGYTFEVIPLLIRRRVKCNNAKVVKKFQQLYLDSLYQHNMINRIFHIQEQVLAGI